MLEEILLFRSTYSKQLFLDATLIGSTDPIQPCRDGESQLCSWQDAHHWQSNPSEYRQYPAPPSNRFWFGLGLVLLLGQWEGVCAGRDSLLSKWPPNSQGKPTVGQRCPETACPTMSCGVQGVTVQPELRGPCCRWGGHPLARVLLPAVPAWAGEKQLFVLPPRPSHCRWPRGNLEPGKTRDRFGMCCGAPATYPLPPRSSGRSSSCAPAPIVYTKHTKEPISQQPLSTRWDKASPGGSRSFRL